MNFIKNVKCFRNAEVMAKFNSQIDEQRSRRENAEIASQRIRELLNEITRTLHKLYDKFQVRIIDYNFVHKCRNNYYKYYSYSNSKVKK